MAKNKKSLQAFLGLQTFEKYGLQSFKDTLAFFSIQAINISVMSTETIDEKIYQLVQVLSMVPNLEIICMDSTECFDSNKHYLYSRLEEETNPAIIKLLQADLEFLDEIQIEMATARQFMFCIRFRKAKDEQKFNTINRVLKAISEHGFDAKLMTKEDIKRMLALYFETSSSGENIADFEGEEYLDFDYLTKGENNYGKKEKKHNLFA